MFMSLFCVEPNEGIYFNEMSIVNSSDEGKLLLIMEFDIYIAATPSICVVNWNLLTYSELKICVIFPQ